MSLRRTAVDGILISLALLEVSLLQIKFDAIYLLPVVVLNVVALLIRRRSPAAAFVCACLALLLFPTVTPCAAVVYTVADRTESVRRSAAAAATVSAILLLGPATILDVGQPITGPFVIESIVFIVSAAGVPAMAAAGGRLSRTRRAVGRQLRLVQEAQEEKQRLYAEVVLAQERSRLAREMHDVVSHQVSLIAVEAGALQVTSTDDDAREAARTLRRLAVSTLDELRSMVETLGSGREPAELTPQPTLADLPALIASSGIRVEVDGEVPATIAPAAARAVYRTVQECLTNIRKHAPGATARIAVSVAGNRIVIRIENGPGTRPALDLPSSRAGLVGLRERADSVGGSFTTEETADGGFAATLILPKPA